MILPCATFSRCVIFLLKIFIFFVFLCPASAPVLLCLIHDVCCSAFEIWVDHWKVCFMMSRCKIQTQYILALDQSMLELLCCHDSIDAVFEGLTQVLLDVGSLLGRVKVNKSQEERSLNDPTLGRKTMVLYFCLFLLLLQLQKLRDVASELTNVWGKFCAYWQSFTTWFRVAQFSHHHFRNQNTDMH